jgi:hypothetical protein
MRPASGSQLTEDLGEVGDVVRDENAPILGRQGEDVLVFEPLELRLLIERPDVVTGVPQPSTDTPPRDMGVEKEAHRAYSGISRKG